MRLNKKVQYGMLFVLYLCRAGRASVDTVCANLGLSAHFMEQVARKLRISGIVKSVRGPGGGYEVVGDPEMADLFASLSPVQLVSREDAQALAHGTAEERALAQYVRSMKGGLNVVLWQTVRSVGNDLVENELDTMDSVEITERAN